MTTAAPAATPWWKGPLGWGLAVVLVLVTAGTSLQTPVILVLVAAVIYQVTSAVKKG